MRWHDCFEIVSLAAPAEGPHVVISAGVHGDEFEPMAAVRELARRLAGTLVRGKLTLAPVVHENAFRLGQRTGEDGLDLARTCPGRRDGTSTERVAFALTSLIRQAEAYIDLHTGGVRLSVTPLVGYMLHRDSTVLEAQRRMARAFGLPLIWGTSPDLEGRSLSVARDAAIPAIYAEFGGGGRFDHDAVAAYVLGCENVLQSWDLIPGSPGAAASAPLVIEDATPGSGHMQVQHPAPREGFFEPRVAPGDWVERGATLGILSDIAGREATPIFSARAGLVVVMHTFARVEKGVGLAVVVAPPG